MSEHTLWESIKIEGQHAADRVKELIAEGNVRRIVIKQGERTIAEFPLAIGVVGAVFAPVLAAISMGAVYMGSLTYIGNAPNFMIYAIASERGIKMPSFFGYLAWSIVVLAPLFVAVTYLFVLPR